MRVFGFASQWAQPPLLPELKEATQPEPSNLCHLPPARTGPCTHLPICNGCALLQEITAFAYCVVDDEFAPGREAHEHQPPENIWLTGSPASWLVILQCLRASSCCTCILCCSRWQPCSVAHVVYGCTKLLPLLVLVAGCPAAACLRTHCSPVAAHHAQPALQHLYNWPAHYKDKDGLTHTAVPDMVVHVPCGCAVLVGGSGAGSGLAQTPCCDTGC